jgi:hypothetical protein
MPGLVFLSISPDYYFSAQPRAEDPPIFGRMSITGYYINHDFHSHHRRRRRLISYMHTAYWKMYYAFE